MRRRLARENVFRCGRTVSFRLCRTESRGGHGTAAPPRSQARSNEKRWPYRVQAVANLTLNGSAAVKAGWAIIQNIGTPNLTAPYAIADDKAAVTCPQTPTPLMLGRSSRVRPVTH
jgi:hypothetical protein